MTVFAVFFICVLSLCSYGVLTFYFSTLSSKPICLKLRLIKTMISVAVGIISYIFKTLALAVLCLSVLLYLAANNFIRTGLHLMHRIFGWILVIGGADKCGFSSRQASKDTKKFKHEAVLIELLVATDLLLSGHTHGGQIFPAGCFKFLYRGFVYGEYTVDNMTVLYPPASPAGASPFVHKASASTL